MDALRRHVRRPHFPWPHAARIHRRHRLRALILILAFTIFGGTAITFQREDLPNFDGSASGEQVLFAMFDNLPLSSITPFILIVVLAVFFITSADSASVIMGTMSSKGDPAPNKFIVIFWGLCMMGIAIVMLLTGGEDVLTGLQNLTILSALPFCIVLLVMMVAFIKDLRSDPMFIRRAYARAAVKTPSCAESRSTAMTSSSPSSTPTKAGVPAPTSTPQRTATRTGTSAPMKRARM
ncbi:BCCT family transporter [Corynebacterium sp. B5-R-101]|nr:BCCT family transporter [Corynebacterium intestinale]